MKKFLKVLGGIFAVLLVTAIVFGFGYFFGNPVHENENHNVDKRVEQSDRGGVGELRRSEFGEGYAVDIGGYDLGF